MNMTKQPPISTYWRIVRDCLVEFYEIGPTDAQRSVTELRKRLKQSGVRMRSADDLVYHSEPIDVASDLAREPLPATGDYRRRYEALKKRYAAGSGVIDIAIHSSRPKARLSANSPASIPNLHKASKRRVDQSAVVQKVLAAR